jgi:hypothetical protein
MSDNLQLKGFLEAVVKRIVSVMVGGLVVGAMSAPAAAQTPAAARAAADQQRHLRYQISQMERMLEGAVEHGLTVVREKLQAAMRAQTFIAENPENAHVRGFRLEGYGVFFDIEVPAFQGTLFWSLKTLDQNDLGLTSALNEIRTFIKNSAGSDTNLQQALRRIELQVAPVAVASTPGATLGARTGARELTGAPAVAPETTGKVEESAPDPMLSDPEEAYRTEVKNQIMDAMLEYSVPLGIRAEEWLTVAARRHDDRPLIAPADSDARSVVIRIKGGDLTAFRAGQLTKDEALKRMEVRVF